MVGWEFDDVFEILEIFAADDSEFLELFAAGVTVFEFGLSFPIPTSLLALTSAHPIFSIPISIKHLRNLKASTPQIMLFNQLLNTHQFIKGNAMLRNEEFLVARKVLLRLEFFGECWEAGVKTLELLLDVREGALVCEQVVQLGQGFGD